MKTLNRKKSIGLYSLVVLAAFLLMSSYAYASPDYYNYWTWTSGYNNAYGVDGWVDGGTSRIIFYDNTGGAKAHIYQVTTTPGPDGDNPNLHPLNPDATGAIAPRVFTWESSFDLQQSFYSHQSEFHVASDRFYLGAQNGIEMYAFDGTYLGNLGAPSPPMEGGYSTQSLAYDAADNDWWAGSIGFDGWVEMYSLDGDNIASGWQLEFSYATPGSHHDGLEMLPNGNLLTADYSGQILEYQQDGTYVATHNHDPWGHELEGMGSGALGHYWGGTHNGLIFEFGGGSLPPPVIPVPIDIKPTSCPNPLNVGNKGILPVTIVGTEDFDVSTVDPLTIELIGVAPLRCSYEDVCTAFYPLLGKESELDCTEEGPDGYLDLTLKFDIQEIVEALGEVDDGEVIVLSLTGNLLEEDGGTPIEGEDVVIILKKGKK